MFLITYIFFFHGNIELQRVRSVEDYSASQSPTKTYKLFVRYGTEKQRFPGLGSLKLYSNFLLSFFTVKLHSCTVKYMFMNFST